MVAKVRITYHGMEGEGRTITEAKRDAGRKIEVALSDSYNPHLIVYRSYAALVYREPSGWAWRLISDPDFGVRAGGVWGHARYESATKAAVEARMHLAQCGWKAGDGNETPDVLRNVWRETHSDYQSWVEFQLRYRVARERGLSDNDAHDYAGRNPARAELWIHEAKTQSA